MAFTYAPSADFSGIDRFAYRTTDGVNSSLPATVTITVNAVAEVIGAQVPASDTGVSNTDRITRDSTPSFSGTAPAGLAVRLLARRDGQASPVAVGMARADSAGNFVATSVALADGFYHFFAEALRPNGRSTGRVALGDLLIDTVAPRITDARLVRQAGRVVVTYHDDASGLEEGSVLNAANYAISHLPSRPRRPIAVTLVTTSSPVAPGAVRTATLFLEDARGIGRRRLLLTIASGGVADVAGNALDGEFKAPYPQATAAPAATSSPSSTPKDGASLARRRSIRTPSVGRRLM